MTEVNLPKFIPSPSNRVITQSVCIPNGTYIIPSINDEPALLIDADDIIVDFQGSVITSGNLEDTQRELLKGIGIGIKKRQNVIIKNAVVSGFKVNIFADECRKLTILNSDVSLSRADRIRAGGEPVDVWLEIRDLDLWRQYGTGIWVENSSGCEVRGCKGYHSQNGLFLISSSHCTISENDFSFNSGWGIALWKVSESIISWNMLDFVNRPWRGGLGADSAAMAVSNSCHDNYIIGNSMTHGGDGFFLTNLSDLGYDEKSDRFFPVGASNDNVIAYNDGSWSPANAFEGTFSDRNIYYKNYANDSGYGFWLGFSNYSLVLENEINRNKISGIAIEHGRGTRIERNIIEDNAKNGIHLFVRQGKPGEEYPSTDIEIRENIIKRCGKGIDLTGSTLYYLDGCMIEDAPVEEELKCDKEPDDPDALTRFLSSDKYERMQMILRTRPAGFRLYRETGRPCGIDKIKVDDYAPVDPLSPD